MRLTNLVIGNVEDLMMLLLKSKEGVILSSLLCEFDNVFE